MLANLTAEADAREDDGWQEPEEQQESATAVRTGERQVPAGMSCSSEVAPHRGSSHGAEVPVPTTLQGRWLSGDRALPRLVN